MAPVNGFDAEQLKALIAVLAPGLLILWVRQWFVAGPSPPFQERVVSYAGVSTVYYAVSVPAFAYFKDVQNAPVWLANGLEYAVLPVLIGALLAISAAHDLVGKSIRALGLSPNHHTPAAWDYAFSRLRGEVYLIVTLADGSRVHGRYAEHSFSSSSEHERDLLIEESWDVDDENQWTLPDDQRAILLCGKDIRAVEIIRTKQNDERPETQACPTTGGS